MFTYIYKGIIDLYKGFIEYITYIYNRCIDYMMKCYINYIEFLYRNSISKIIDEETKLEKYPDIEEVQLNQIDTDSDK